MYRIFLLKYVQKKMVQILYNKLCICAIRLVCMELTFNEMASHLQLRKDHQNAVCYDPDIAAVIKNVYCTSTFRVLLRVNNWTTHRN